MLVSVQEPIPLELKRAYDPDHDAIRENLDGDSNFWPLSLVFYHYLHAKYRMANMTRMYKERAIHMRAQLMLRLKYDKPGDSTPRPSSTEEA